MLLSAAAQPGRSWAGLIALSAAYVIFRVGSWVYVTFIKSPSPTRALPTAERVKAKATVGVNTDRTDHTEEGWWGKIREVGGVRYRQVKHVLATGNSLPEADEDDELEERDDDLDVPLDDEDDEEEETGKAGETPTQYVARCRRIGVSYRDIVRVLMDHYGLTVDQAKYCIRKVDGERRDSAAA